MPSLNLPSSYISNSQPQYFHDTVLPRIAYQPEVYVLADYLASKAQRHSVVDIGCGSGLKAARLSGSLRVTGVDIAENLVRFRENCPRADAFAIDLEKVCFSDLPQQVDWRSSVVICADVIEHLVDPHPLLSTLAAATTAGAIVIISTPDRDRARGFGNLGPPGNPAHVREWTLEELAGLLEQEGFPVSFKGHTISDNLQRRRDTSLIIGDSQISRPKSLPIAPLAIISCYNDEDCIRSLSEEHLKEGLDLHFVDNWSTDNTFQIIETLASSYENRVTMERFPASGPTNEYRWKDILRRKQEVAAQYPGRWVLSVDSDELRRGPWPEYTLAESLSIVDSYGCNAVDFCVVEFKLTTDGFCSKDNPVSFFKHFDFGRHASYFKQIRAWKQPGRTPVDIASSGGHDALFAGKLVFPYRFYLGHYPLRSVDQAARKIFKERRPRSKSERDEFGWHIHYDHISENTPLLSPGDLFLFKAEGDIREEYLPELVSDAILQRTTGSLLF